VTNPSSEAPAAAAASRIIAAEALRGVAAFALTELAQQGNAPLRRLTARDLSNETARAAYALGRRRGLAQGMQAGLQQGYSEGSQALEEFECRTAAEVVRQMQQLLEGFRGEMAALESQVASDLVSLAIDIARQVLRREISCGAAALLPAAREALRALGEGASQLELHLNPADADLLANQLEAVQAGLCRVQEDPAMPLGGCRVEADTGVAEAGFEARWQAVMAALGREEEPLP
jgi:flagellar assembly protein FliH